jgi:predicted RNA-binding protein YlxR (DUF448 family)
MKKKAGGKNISLYVNMEKETFQKKHKKQSIARFVEKKNKNKLLV